MRDLTARKSDDALRTLQAVFTLIELNDEGIGAARAEGRLRMAVQAARDAGVEWGDIGSVLGIARGNAYQRYRRRPSPARVVDRRPPPQQKAS